MKGFRLIFGVLMTLLTCFTTVNGYSQLKSIRDLSETLEYDFEDGLQGWTSIDNDGDGNNWMHRTGDGINAHSGMGVAASESYINYVGALTPDNWLVSPQVVLGGTMTFWAAGQDPSYVSEHFAVYVSTSGNDVSNFTQVMNETVATSTMTQYTVDLSSYSGNGYVAIRHYNCTDMFRLNVDDIALDEGGTNPDPDPTTSMAWDFEADFAAQQLLDWTTINANNDEHTWYIRPTALESLGHNDSQGFVTSTSYMSAPITPDDYLVSPQLTLGGTFSFWACAQDASYPSEHFGVAVSTAGNTSASDFTMVDDWTLTAKGTGGYTNDTRSGNRVQGNWYQYTVDLGSYAGQTGYIAIRHYDCSDWFRINVDDVAYSVGDTPSTGWIYYDDGVNVEAIGIGGGQFYWGVMFPAGTYAGNGVLKVAAYDYMAMNGTVTIYNDGATAPSNPVGSMDVVLTGSGDFVEFDFASPVIIDPSKNLWVVFCNLSGATYPAAVCANTGDPNGRWVSIDGVEWMDLLNAGSSLDYTFMVRAFVVENSTSYYSISVTANPVEGGDVTGAGTYAEGSTCTLHANPNDGYDFVKWTRNGTQVSTDPDYSFVVTGDAAFVAHFQQTAMNYTISAMANPSEGGVVTGAGTYSSGASCTLKATAKTGYNFVNWTRDGVQVSTNATYIFTVTGNGSYVANFVLKSYSVNASADPSEGGTVSGAGNYAHGSSCTLKATAKTGYAFSKWTKNGNQVSTNTTYTFIVNGNGTYVAHFNPKSYTVSASAEPSAGGTVTGAGSYSYGSSCTLKATPKSGYSFINWTKNGSQVSNSAEYTFTVTGNSTYVAHFGQNVTNYIISASATPAAGGTVTGAGTYAQGSVCTLTASANSGYSFVKWTKNGSQVSNNPIYSFTVTGNGTYVAHFEQGLTNYIITATVNPSNAGTITGAGTYAQGTSCSLMANANTGYKFVNWTENGSQISGNATYTFTVDRNRTLKANFEKGTTYIITAASGPHGTISPSGNIEVDDGANKTFSMRPDAGYAVGKIFVDGIEVAATESYTFQEVSCDHSIYVSFSGLGVEEESNTGIIVFPNPVRETVDVKCDDMERITFYDLNGNVIISKDVNSNHETIGVNGLAAGVYVIELTLKSDQRCYGKVIKE